MAVQAQAALAKAARREEERDAVHAGEAERLRALDRKHEEQAEKAAAEARRLAEARIRKAEAARDEAMAAAARGAAAVAAAEAEARLERDRAAALEAEVEAATGQAEDERENAAGLGMALQSERQILRSMSVLMRSRLSELVGEAGGDGTAEAAKELEAMLARGGELEEQLRHKERLVARQGELLGAAAVDRLTSLRRTAARRAEAETLHRRAGEALAALPAPRRTQRVAWDAGGEGGGGGGGGGGEGSAGGEGVEEELRGLRASLSALHIHEQRDEREQGAAHERHMKRALVQWSAERAELLAQLERLGQRCAEFELRLTQGGPNARAASSRAPATGTPQRPRTAPARDDFVPQELLDTM